jgi:heavy metal sensor kinase
LKGIGTATLRTKLTAWYVFVLGAVVLLYAAGASTALFFYLRHELDEGLVQNIETVEGLLTWTSDGKVSLGNEAHDPDSDAEEDRLIEVRTLNGALLYRNKTLGNESLGGAPFSGEGRNGYSERSSRLPDGTRIRLASRVHQLGSTPVLIRLGESEEPLQTEFRQMLAILLLGLPFALGIAALGGYALARRALAPIDVMARRAEKITAERLNERLPVENPRDELGQLARVFNETLARLEQSFEQLRRFTADASHELRTPLTAIRSVGEVGLQKRGDVSYYRDIIGSMLEEANRLTRLVDSLLTMSRADAGTIQLNRAELRLIDLARASAELLEVLADEKGQSLSVIGDESVVVTVDRLILRQALVNLVDNALKYSPVGGAVCVRVKSDAGQEAIVEVQDDGPGIAPEHQSKIFDRFYRVDKARSREAGGAGLGLAITRWAVEVNGGRIEVESDVGNGALFRVCLPLAKMQQPVPQDQRPIAS